MPNIPRQCAGLIRDVCCFLTAAKTDRYDPRSHEMCDCGAPPCRWEASGVPRIVATASSAPKSLCSPCKEPGATAVPSRPVKESGSFAPLLGLLRSNHLVTAPAWRQRRAFLLHPGNERSLAWQASAKPRRGSSHGGLRFGHLVHSGGIVGEASVATEPKRQGSLIYCWVVWSPDLRRYTVHGREDRQGSNKRRHLRPGGPSRPRRPRQPSMILLPVLFRARNGTGRI